MQELFEGEVAREASDGDFMRARIHGKLQPVSATPIEEVQSHSGSQPFDQHLLELGESKEVDFEFANSAANNPADFDLKMNMFGEEAASSGAQETQRP
jgi:hypothetical protein